MGIPVLSGRAFSETAGDAAPRVAIVSSLFERRYSPTASAIGMRFRWQAEWWTVVGVVGDTKHQGLDAAELRATEQIQWALTWCSRLAGRSTSACWPVVPIAQRSNFA
jgi:hypothetical protein